MTSILGSKKVWIIGIVAATIIVIGFGISHARAAIMEQSAMTMATAGNYGQIPQLNGSINVGKTVKNFINDNVKVSFSQASKIASKQIVNGTLVGGHLGVVQGYLVYTFYAVNTANQTGHLVVVDPGNGKALYTSESQPMFGQFGPWKTYGFGESCHGQFGSWNTYGYNGGIWQQNSPLGMDKW